MQNPIESDRKCEFRIPDVFRTSGPQRPEDISLLLLVGLEPGHRTLGPADKTLVQPLLTK